MEDAHVPDPLTETPRSLLPRSALVHRTRSFPHRVQRVAASACMLLAMVALFTARATPAATEGAATTTSTPDFARLVEHHAATSVADRRWIHEHPELSLREFDTQAYLRAVLEGIPGIELVDGEWGTGVVAVLRGAHPGPTIAWRTDMDALPVTEETGLSCASTARDTLSGGREVGVMHACGHDMHMAIALGLARVLSDVREQMHGTLLWIGEPAEEIGAGAPSLLEAGLFEDDREPACALALHVHPTIPLGQVGACPGWATGNVDGFLLTVRGDGGHGAYPHRGVDPVTVAARMVLAFQSIIGREIDVNHDAVISVGRIEGGTKSNVIPSEVLIEATVRSHDDATRQALAEKIERTVMGLAQAAGAPEPELQYYLGTPAGYNDPELVAQCRQVFRRIVGPENEILYEAGMGGEDFAYYGQRVPGFQFRLGVGVEDQPTALHRANFAPDESAIATGMRLAAELVWDQLGRRRDGGEAGGKPVSSGDGE
ncbi:MAG: M20 family metallopeptidase [Candidatus Eiseniibacteriota bacterium]|jgi:hippurate hydrolase